jgi:hypothetical protein
MEERKDQRFRERRVSQRRTVGAAFFSPCESGALWRTSAEILGYSVEAADGAVGRVEDFCIEEESSVITAMVVRARGALPRQRRLRLPLSAIERVDWQRRKVYLRPACAEIRRWSEAACPPPQHAARA